MLKAFVSFAREGERSFPPLQIKLSSDATIADAIECLNSRGVPASANWGCDSVKLKGVVSYSEIQDESAKISMVLPQFAISGSLMDDDCLVVESTSSNEPNDTIRGPTKDESAASPSRFTRAAATKARYSSNDTPSSEKRKNKSTASPTSDVEEESASSDDDDASSDDDDAVSGKRKRIKKAKSDSGSRRRNKKQENKTDQSGFDGFVKHKDGICYPVRLHGKSRSRTKINVKFIGYRTVHTIPKSKLLPVTNERTREYEHACEIAESNASWKKAEAKRIAKEAKERKMAKRVKCEDQNEGGQCHSAREDAWFLKLKELQKYKAKHGHCNVSGQQDRSLYRWLMRQRVKLQLVEGGGIPRTKEPWIEELRKLGVSPTSTSGTASNGVTLSTNGRSKNAKMGTRSGSSGATAVISTPSKQVTPRSPRTRTASNGASSKTKGHARSESSGTTEVVETPSKREQNWYRMLEELKQHKAKHGSARVSVQANSRLYNWCHRQKEHLALFRAGNPSSLNEAWVKELEDVGM